jgi:hypothetical protein
MDASSGPRRHRAVRYGRIERDGYLAIDAHWAVPALLRSAPIEGRYWSRPPARFRTTARRLASARRASGESQTFETVDFETSH